MSEEGVGVMVDFSCKWLRKAFESKEKFCRNRVFSLFHVCRICTRFDTKSAVQDAYRAIPKARPASPRSAIGCPSRSVADDAGVPGVLIRMAGMEPPSIN